MSDSSTNRLDNSSNDANQNMSPTPAGSPVQSCGSPPDTPASPENTHWIAIELVDKLGKRVPYEDYQITLPDGTLVEGCLDQKGRAKITGIDPGTCKISFPCRDKEVWRPA